MTCTGRLFSTYVQGKRDLCGANLCSADLHGVNLCRANLFYANLRGADLSDVNLYAADLRHADLSGANLRGANLHHADLHNADLSNTDFSNADLAGTVLDPNAHVPRCSAYVIRELGLELGVEDGRDVVRGWRTAKSQHVKGYEYVWGWYNAPVFSVDTRTACHPGLYLASRRWLREEYPNVELVRCWCYRDEMVVTWEKARAKWLCITD